MFSEDFYPTLRITIETMIDGYDLYGKKVLEPSAGAGNIVDYLHEMGAEVIACENHPSLLQIVKTKCRIVKPDFLTVTSEDISHIDAIVMNPPFSDGVKHILHAFSIAPPGCNIFALCNADNLEHSYSKSRKELIATIENYGEWGNIGKCFTTAERKTNCDIALIRLQKPGQNYEAEFEGFFEEEDPEELQNNGIISYNAVRDLVNRYVAAVKLFDSQIDIGIKMFNLTNSFYNEKLSFTCTEKGAPKLRNDFKKDLQKAGWKFIFAKMNMEKFSTRGVRADINKFVEHQTNIPFTMKNIYRMLQIVVGTAGQRMDKALLEVFDKLTEHHADNRYNVEGWKTNSHYLVNKKFILPNMCYQDQRWYKGEENIQVGYGSYFDFMEDMGKALCYITGDQYETLGCLSKTMKYQIKIITDKEIFYYSEDYEYSECDRKKKELYEKGIKYTLVNYKPVYGEWFEWSYFRCKAFKKGSMHFEFKDHELWGKFNQRIAKLKGYPLFEAKKQTKYQDRQTGRGKQEKADLAHAFKPNFEKKVA
jgi:hypothetical protein